MSNAFSFVLIDPYGPQATPFSVVSRIVDARRSDTMINFPFYSFQKWTGFIDRDPTTLAPDEKARVDAADAFFGDRQWRAVAEKARKQGTSLHDALLAHYLDRLSTFGVFRLALPLRFEKRASTVYDLIFTSRSVAGLAAAKRNFVKGQTKQFQLRREAEERETGQTSLFGEEQFQPAAVDIEALAAHLAECFDGQNPSLEDLILAGLNWRTAVDSDVNKALTRLRTKGVIQTTPERYRDIVAFRKM